MACTHTANKNNTLIYTNYTALKEPLSNTDADLPSTTLLSFLETWPSATYLVLTGNREVLPMCTFETLQNALITHLMRQPAFPKGTKKLKHLCFDMHSST